MKRQDKTSLTRALVGALLAIVIPAVAFAGGGGPGNPVGGGNRGGDDVTSTPRWGGQSRPGFVLTVDDGDLQVLLSSARGAGSVQVQPVGQGRLAVAFRGSFTIGLRRDAIASGRVGIDYVGPRGRGRMVELGGRVILAQR